MIIIIHKVHSYMVDFPIIVRDQSAIFSAERNTRLAQFTCLPVSLPDRSTMVILD